MGLVIPFPKIDQGKMWVCGNSICTNCNNLNHKSVFHKTDQVLVDGCKVCGAVVKCIPVNYLELWCDSCDHRWEGYIPITLDFLVCPRCKDTIIELPNEILFEGESDYD